MTKANKPYKPAVPVDVADLTICNDPPPQARTNPDGKYSALFDSLPAEKRLKCPTGTASRIGQGLRKWMEKNKVPGTVKSTENYGDGAGGVWMIPPAKALRKVA